MKKNWSNRVPKFTRISEIDSLVDDFNAMVSVVEQDHVQLRNISVTDALTGIYNRRGFEAKLNEEFERSKRFDSPFSLILIDMDNFKFINDNYGHPAGDSVLKEMTFRLNNTLRSVDIFSRIGGDEFVIILPGADPSGGMSAAQKIHHVLNESLFPISPSVKLPVTASIGVACFPRDGQDAHELLLAVDAVMYKAKKHGKNCVISLEDESQNKISCPIKLRSALDDGRIEVAFQPILSIEGGEIFAHEALCRIRDGELLHAAEYFIEAAEHSGLVHEIDDKVLRKGLSIMKREFESGGKFYKTFFNVSSLSFGNKEWMMSIPDLAANAGVPLEFIVLEITERQELPDIFLVKEIIDQLRNMGIQFAIDDFGSGFSSFFYLQQLNVDYLKIDGGFVRCMISNKGDSHIVENINHIAKSFGLRTIAEFVEDEQTLTALKKLGIDSVQGYHVGKPVLR